MFRKILSAAGVVAILIGAATFASAAPPPKVTICHATASATNPYVQITVDADAVNGAGHGQDHSGHAGDIIPPVAGVTSGQNWDATGQAIYNAGCRFATPPTTVLPQPPTTVPQPPPTTTAPVEPPVQRPPAPAPTIPPTQPPAAPEPELVPPAADAPAVQERAPELPRTGRSLWLVWLGAGLITGGAWLVFLGRR
jgi:LPXTG-motif cell wall-anchored protein